MLAVQCLVRTGRRQHRKQRPAAQCLVRNQNTAGWCQLVRAAAEVPTWPVVAVQLALHSGAVRLASQASICVCAHSQTMIRLARHSVLKRKVELSAARSYQDAPQLGNKRSPVRAASSALALPSGNGWS